MLVEIGQRTWDFQRLSSLTPLAMTWGKLFGATALAWGVGLVGLVILLLIDPSPAVGAMALRALGIGVLLQSLMLAAALVGVRKARAEGRQPSLRSVMGGGVFVLIVIWSLVGSRLARTGARVGGLGELLSVGKGDITWWGSTFEANAFATVAALVFAAWAFVAAWRLMRLELQMHNTPWVWTGFLVFLAAFVAGLVPDDRLASGAASFLRWASASFIFAAAAYAGAFMEPADRVRLASFGQAATRRDWKRALPMTPLSLPPLLLAVVSFTAMAITSDAARDVAARFDQNAGPAGWLTPSLIAAGFVFMIRDLGVITYFRFGPRPRRGDFAAILALALIYWILPLFGMASGGPAGLGLALFAPHPLHATLSLVSGALQAMLVWTFAVRRLKGAERAA